MRFLKIGDLGGVRNIGSKTGIEKNTAALPRMGIFGYGFDKTTAASAISKPSGVVSQELAAKWANVAPLQGPPTQLFIDDAYYIPDKAFADEEV